MADDQPVAAAGTAQQLTANSYEVCAIVDDVARFRAVFELLKPDVLLVETSMGARGAAPAAVVDLLGKHPGVPVVAFTSELSLVTIETALEVGCRAVVPKTSTVAALLVAIEAVLAGERHLHPRVVAVLLGRKREPESPVRPTALSAREREVLELVADGLTNHAIGVRLGISETTVKTHVSGIFRKLGATDRAQAVGRGLRSGLIV